MADTVSSGGQVRTVTLVIESKPTELKGLNEALSKLRKIQAAVHEIQQSLNGISLAKIAALGKINIAPLVPKTSTAAIAQNIKASIATTVAPAVSTAVTDSIIAGVEAGVSQTASKVKVVADNAKQALRTVETYKGQPGLQKDVATDTKTGTTQTTYTQNAEALDKEKARLALIEKQRAEALKLREEMNAIQSQGFKKHSSVTSVTGDITKESEIWTRQQKGMREVVKFDFEKDAKGYRNGAKTAREFSTEIEKVDSALRAANRNLITNLSHVTTWAASVGVLYGTLGLVRSSTESFIRIGMQTARLSQVFRGLDGSAAGLADSVMMSAAAYGRSADEALEAAISWSRMGLSMKEVGEATRVSMMAANVAEMDAATATQHMQAIMITYKMQASELGGALGILNDISNKYAVTNNDLLTGISRTGAIAQQAGLSFAELSGIIGATVAATKQSGANIGNAVKSIITAFGNPAIQQFMRNMGVEVTAGAGDEIKDFSQTLKELYLTYQNLSTSERQFMLYRVAGKTQSQRMQAMLDNYIQSQIRAISAQLNLNSAEIENQKIIGTLQAQLKGLTAEWERFVVIQGNSGPGTAMKGIVQTFHNLLAVMNAPGIHWITTGFLAAITAMSAKMLLLGSSSKAVGQQFGFIGASTSKISAVRKELSGMTTAYMGAFGQRGGVGKFLSGAYSAGGGIQSWGSHTAFNMQLGAHLGTLPPIIDKAIGYLNKLSLGLNTGSQSWRMFAGGVKVASTAIGGFVKVAAVGAAVLAEWIVPMLAIGLAMKAFGMITDALGLTMNRYKKQMEGVDAQIQAAQNASEAYLRTVKLLDTAQKEMAGGKAGADNIKKWTNAFRGMGDALGNNLADELEKATGENVSGILSNYKEKFLSKAFAEEQKLYDRRKEALQKAQQNLESLRKKPTTSSSNLVAAEDEVKQKSTELLDSFMKVSKAVSDWAENNEAVQATLERNKLTLEAIRSIYEAMPTGGKADRNLMNIKLLERESEMEEQFRHQLDLTQKQAAEEMTATSQRRDKISKEIAEYHDKLSRMDAGGNATFDARKGWINTGQEAVNLRNKIRALEDEYSQLSAPSALADTVAREKTIQSAERSRQIEANLRAKRAAQADFELADRYDLARTLAGYEGEAGAYGRNRTGVLRNQGRSIMEQMKANRALAMGGDDNAKIALQKNIYDLQSNILKLVERRYEIEKEEKQLIIDKRKEYEKALMLAGPGDMLKRLAAFRMAQSGMGMGGFMAMSPDIREMMGQVNPMRYSYEGMGLTRERKEAGGITGDLTTKTLQDMILAIRRAAVDAVNGLKMPKLPDSPAFINMQEAAQALAGVKTEAVLLQTSFANLRSVVDALNAPPSTGWDVTNPGQIDAGPQSRGHYPGKVSDFSVHPKL